MEFAGIITLGEIVDGNKWTFTSNNEIVKLREGYHARRIYMDITIDMKIKKSSLGNPLFEVIITDISGSQVFKKLASNSTRLAKEVHRHLGITITSKTKIVGNRFFGLYTSQYKKG